jgi:hypothetical protein
LSTFKFVMLILMLALLGASLNAQETTPGSHKGKEHRMTGGTKVGTDLRKPSGGATNIMGDGSVRFNKQAQGTQTSGSKMGTQSSGAGAGKVTITSGTSESGGRHPNLNKRVRSPHKSVGSAK